MNNAERILHALRTAGAPLCDDCVSDSAAVRPRQQVNQIASRLARSGRISRRSSITCGGCGRTKLTSSLGTAAGGARPTAAKAAAKTAILRVPPDDRPWNWEGNVQNALKAFLEAGGWMITAEADTESQQQGVDLAARRGQRELYVEVKGFPTRIYERGVRRGQPKPTLPTNQARQWFSHALLSLMRLRGKHPSAEIALCFPDFPTYRNLLRQVRGSLELLGAGVYLVRQDGAVERYLDAGTPG